MGIQFEGLFSNTRLNFESMWYLRSSGGSCDRPKH